MKTAAGNKEFLKILRQHLRALKRELKPCTLSPQAHNRFMVIEQIFDQALYRDIPGIGISAQVSLYPLRVKSLSPFINEAMKIFEDLGVSVFPGSMSTVITGTDKFVWQALRDAFSACANRGELVMTITVSNACPLPVKPAQSG